MQKTALYFGTICYKLPNVKYDLQFGSLCKVSLTLSEIIRVTWGLVTEKYKKVTQKKRHALGRCSSG
jgi:hypothetical protein